MGIVPTRALVRLTLPTDENDTISKLKLNFSEFEQKQCTLVVRRNDLGTWKIFLELILGEVIS